MKNKWIAILMAVFLGTFGVHRFYLRQTEIGLVFIGIYIWVKFINILGFPFSTLWGWYDAYRYLMMDQNEFDRKFNSKNFRDRYGNRREFAKNDDTKKGRYIILDQDQANEQERSGSIFEKYKKRKELETFKQKGITHFKNYELNQAIEYFHKVISTDPNDMSSHFYLSCAYSLSENAKKSFEHLHQAVLLGFKDWNRILTQESLAYIRVLPEFELFKQNQYKLNNEILEKLNLRENRLFDDLQMQRDVLLQTPKSTYGSYFQQVVNNEFK